jgi:hypothetical protein
MHRRYETYMFEDEEPNKIQMVCCSSLQTVLRPDPPIPGIVPFVHVHELCETIKRTEGRRLEKQRSDIATINLAAEQERHALLVAYKNQGPHNIDDNHKQRVRDLFRGLADIDQKAGHDRKFAVESTDEEARDERDYLLDTYLLEEF